MAEEIVQFEWDAGLGNGGLGRLAACFLDYNGNPGYPDMDTGYGMNMEYLHKNCKRLPGGIPENWLRYGNPWELARPELIYPVDFYGRSNTVTGKNSGAAVEWTDTDQVMAMAYDTGSPDTNVIRSVSPALVGKIDKGVRSGLFSTAATTLALLKTRQTAKLFPRSCTRMITPWQGKN